MPILQFLKTVALISWDFLGAALFAAVAWIFWQIGVGEWMFFRLFAAIFAGGVVVCAGKGLWKLGKLLIHDLMVASFNRKAAKPKADPRAFTSFKEAERVSKAMGEEHAVASGLGLDSETLKTSTNLSLIKQPQMSAAELLSLPPDMQLVHMRGFGFFLCPSISQANIAPYCDLVADNLLEGGRLPPDPKITLKTPEVT